MPQTLRSLPCLQLTPRHFAFPIAHFPFLNILLLLLVLVLVLVIRNRMDRPGYFDRHQFLLVIVFVLVIVIELPEPSDCTFRGRDSMNPCLR